MAPAVGWTGWSGTVVPAVGGATVATGPETVAVGVAMVVATGRGLAGPGVGRVGLDGEPGRFGEGEFVGGVTITEIAEVMSPITPDIVL